MKSTSDLTTAAAPLATPEGLGREGLVARPLGGNSAIGPAELAGVAAIALLALAVRWPEYMTIPRFTDEYLDVMPGLGIARGLEFPIVTYQPYFGPLFNYLVAASFLLVGPQIEAGRLVVLLAGALTTVPAYLLGRSIGGPIIGLLTALLLATSAAHIAVNSHVASSSCVTPLFSTTGLWLLHRAVTGRSGPHLAASGLAFGLALQTHLSVLAIWPGLAVYLVWKGRPLFGRWMVLAGALALLAVSNLVFFNLVSGMSGLATTAETASKYVGGQFTLGGWLERLLLLLEFGTAALGGLITPIYDDPMLNPFVAIYGVLALVGLVLLARRGEWLPVLTMSSGLLLISFLNGRLEPIVVRGRYYALLLPLGYLGVSFAVWALHGYVLQAIRRQWVLPVSLGRAAGPVMVLALVCGPLLLLRDYYEWAYRVGRTNYPILATVDAVSRASRSGEPVHLDRQLEVRQPSTGTWLVQNLQFGFALQHRSTTMVDLEQASPPIEPQYGESLVLVVRSGREASAQRHYRLEPLPGEPGPRASLRAFRAFTVNRSQ